MSIPGQPALSELDRLRFEFAMTLDEQRDTHRAELDGLLTGVVTALDSMDRLLSVADPATATDPAAEGGPDARVDAYRDSLRLIAEQLEKAVRAGGLEPIGRPGERAEPATHQVVEVRQAAAGAGQPAEDEVLQVVQRGYRLRERVLRPARVVVAVRELPPPPSATPGT